MLEDTLWALSLLPFLGLFPFQNFLSFFFFFLEICTIKLGIFAPTVEMWFGLFFF